MLHGINGVVMLLTQVMLLVFMVVVLVVLMALVTKALMVMVFTFIGANNIGVDGVCIDESW